MRPPGDVIVTTQKHLKQAVRTRMAKTGERYAAARRAVVAATPERTRPAHPVDDRPAQPGLLPGYIRIGGAQPDVSPLANALVATGIRDRRTGAPLSESLIYGLGGGVGGGYFMFQYEGTPTAVAIGTRIRWHEPLTFITTILDRLAVRRMIHEGGNRKAADVTLAAALAAGHPTLVWVDRASLPHGGLPDEYRRYVIRIVGLAGRDASTGAWLLDDRATRPLPISPDRLWESRGLIATSKRRLIEMEGADLTTDLPKVVLAAIHDGHLERTTPRIRNFGLPGIEKWATQVGSTTDPKGWRRTLTDDLDLTRTLRQAWSAIDGGAGGAGGRELYAAFLDAAATLTGRAGLAEAADHYQALADDWRALAIALLPGSIEPLARIHRLETDRWTAYDRPDGPDLDRFLAISEELEADDREVMRAFAEHRPPPTIDGPEIAAADREALLDDLAGRIAAIHRAEVAASDLADAAAA